MERTIEVVGISDELLDRLDQQADRIGVDRSSYVRRLIERAVAPPGSWSTLAELVAPLHDYTESHGISKKEIEQLFSEQIAERRRGGGKSDQGGRTTS